MSDILNKIAGMGVVPVIKIEDPETAVPLADAIRKGGINNIEVTVRNETAYTSIKAIKSAFPDMLVGAGTILNPAMVDEALAAGADYIVAPGLHVPTVRRCAEAGVPIVPGCTSASEIQTALDEGLTVLKFFPAEASGGLKTIKDLAGPFSQVRFVATGGMSFDNMGAYLRTPAVAAIGGSFMAKADVIARHDWETITANCKKCMDLCLGFELAHVGINQPTKDEAVSVAEALNERFPLGVKVGGKSTFLGTAVEVMHTMFYGTNGHIGFKVNSAERAKAYFESKGLTIKEETLTYKNGRLNFFYLEEEVGGFAVHVVAK